MGLVTRRSQQLDKLFDDLAIDPKQTHKPLKNKDQKKEKNAQDKK